MSTGVIEVSEEDKRKHKEVEKDLREVSTFRALRRSVTYPPAQGKNQVGLASQSKEPINARYNVITYPFVQVLLLGSGDSGKSTILKASTKALSAYTLPLVCNDK
jgi:predicted AAA+ superfamily ATPase